MFEMHTFTAEELLNFLNENKGEVIYLELSISSLDTWTLLFRKTVMGRPKREEITPEVIPEIAKTYNEPKPQFGFPVRDDA